MQIKVCAPPPLHTRANITAPLVDIRLDDTQPLNFTRSINLALSERGINALRHADSPDLLDEILADTVPMHGRMVHTAEKGELKQSSQRYDAFGRFQRAADRAGLNKRLLDEIEGMPNIKIFFNHKLTGADFNRNLAWLEDKSQPHPKWHTTIQTKASYRPNEIEISFDLMIGADGAYSATRFHLMKFARMTYSQEYIDTLWCEFHIAPLKRPDGTTDFAISPDHLHIWPSASREFMFIAIPSTDKSFTCTLFMPATNFDYIDAAVDDRLLPFFNKHFPGVAGGLISVPDMFAQYEQNPHLPLISIKCAPYHFGSSAVIIGDAAHAMLPFYGQGMNAGLEDVRELFSALDKHAPTASTAAGAAHARAQALAAYTEKRVPDAHAVLDLARGNYAEMRSGVVSATYQMKKRVEETLSVRAPWSGFVTQYARVSFSNERYSEVIRNVEWQSSTLGWVGLAAAGALFASSLGFWRVYSR